MESSAAPAVQGEREKRVVPEEREKEEGKNLLGKRKRRKDGKDVIFSWLQIIKMCL